MNANNEDITLAEMFCLNPYEYANVSLFTLPFSIRVLNRFEQLRMLTVKDMLSAEVSFLRKIPGFGAGCMSQVYKYCEQLTQREAELGKKEIREVFQLLASEKARVSRGDFSFVSNELLSENQKKVLLKIEEGYSLLGEDLVNECINSPDHIAPILFATNQFNDRKNKSEKLADLLKQIPEERKHNCFKYYLDAFSNDEYERNLISKCYRENTKEIADIVDSVDYEDETLLNMAFKFLSWCSFDLKCEIAKVFEKVYEVNRAQTVIEGRANRLTLNELGELLGVTRERVRQIEKKAFKVFFVLVSRGRIVQKLYAEQNGQNIITLEDIAEVSQHNSSAFIYLLKEFQSGMCTYDRQLDVFVYGDTDLSTKIQNYIDSLPDMIRTNEIKEIVENAQLLYAVKGELVEKALNDSYRITGNVLHRTRLTLAQIYETILKKYYPEGIHVTDDAAIYEFRRLVVEEYGEVSLPESNHAIAARLSSIGVLSGRGVYVARKEKWMPDELANRILDFIMQESSSVLGTAIVFSMFEEELVSAGIYNRYLLQGVLRELYGDKLYFRRDYISKDKEFSSFYSSIVSFIKESKYPVKREEIKQRFPGVTDIVISLATGDSDVLNYFGEYLHGSRLIIRENEKRRLHDMLENIVADQEPHHIKDIFPKIKEENSEVLLRNAAVFPFSAFSILEYLFREDFQFSRPFVARNDVEIGRPGERLHELIYSTDEISIGEISEFAKENHFSIQVMIDYINSLNDKYLLIDASTLMTIEQIGITENMAISIEEDLFGKISSTIPIGDVMRFVELPRINVKWTEWLVYSMLQKWGKSLEVAISSNQFRNSVPLIARKGEMDKARYVNVDLNQRTIQVDDMDDIDNLIADIVVDEIQEEQNEF